MDPFKSYSYILDRYNALQSISCFFSSSVFLCFFHFFSLFTKAHVDLNRSGSNFKHHCLLLVWLQERYFASWVSMFSSAKWENTSYFRRFMGRSVQGSLINEGYHHHSVFILYAIQVQGTLFNLPQALEINQFRPKGC